jgi:hypothetical protein
VSAYGSTDDSVVVVSTDDGTEMSAREDSGSGMGGSVGYSPPQAPMPGRRATFEPASLVSALSPLGHHVG